MSRGYLSLTDADREAMLEAIGVASIDELFEQIPEGVRFGRELDVPEALPEAALVAPLRGARVPERRHVARAELPRDGDLRPLRAVDRRHVPLARRAPDRLHAVPARDEPGRAPGDLRVPDRDLRADRDGRLERLRATTGRPSRPTRASSPARTPGRSKVVLAETLNPQVRQVVKTYAPGLRHGRRRGRRTTAARPIPTRFAEAAADAAVAIFQQPNAFGCLEPAPELAAAANDGGALPVAHVDLASLGLLEAPGNYGCAMAIGEGQSIGNYQSYGGPHYGFLAARNEFIRRMPGRIVGETTDLEGKRGFVLTLQTREQHIRREKATSNITTNQTLLALGGLITLCWLGPGGAARAGGGVHRARRVREGAGRAAARVRPADRSRRSRSGRRSPRARSSRAHASTACIPGYPLGRDYPGLDDVLLVALTEKRTPADVDRLADVLAEVTRLSGAHLREVEAGPPRGPRPVARPAGSGASGRAPARAPAAAARGAGERDRPALHGARRPELRDRHGLLPARQLHDEAQPARQRARRRAARVPRPPSAAGGRRRPGRARAHVGARADPRRGRRAAGGHAPARGGLAGRADRA